MRRQSKLDDREHALELIDAEQFRRLGLTGTVPQRDVVRSTRRMFTSPAGAAMREVIPAAAALLTLVPSPVTQGSKRLHAPKSIVTDQVFSAGSSVTSKPDGEPSRRHCSTRPRRCGLISTKLWG